MSKPPLSVKPAAPAREEAPSEGDKRKPGRPPADAERNPLIEVKVETCLRCVLPIKNRTCCGRSDELKTLRWRVVDGLDVADCRCDCGRGIEYIPGDEAKGRPTSYRYK